MSWLQGTPTDRRGKSSKTKQFKRSGAFIHSLPAAKINLDSAHPPVSDAPDIGAREQGGGLFRKRSAHALRRF
jgi:hypothetical protein